MSALALYQPEESVLMGSDEGPKPRNSLTRKAVWGVLAAALAPLAVVALLRFRPEVDAHWENHPAHFWLVLLASAIATALGYAITVASQRRQDARLLLISLGFIAGAGFLGLHALATPGVLLGPNAGFELATPFGLALGGVLIAISAVELTPATSRRIMVRSRAMLIALVMLMALWAFVSLMELPPLDLPLQQEALQGWQLVFAGVGVVGYAAAAVGYLRLYRRRRARFVFAVALSVALLAAAMIVIAFAANWRISWWEWHVLMLAAFGLIGAAAREEWHEERFSALYLEQTLQGAHDVSVLFADLQGFTSYSERNEPREVKRMLDAYYSRVVPLLEQLGGEVHQIIGDAVMVVFNKQGDQPDHAVLSARAGLAFQDAASGISDREPDWPRFRIGVNSGEVVVGVVGERGHRKHGVIGDTVNLAARLEAQAPAGAVVIGEGTYRRLPDGALVEPLAPLELKGKADPVTAYLLRAL